MEPTQPPTGMAMDCEAENAVSVATSSPEPLSRVDAESESQSYVERLNSQDGKGEAISDLETESVEAEEKAARQVEQGAIGSLNGFADYEERKRHERDHEVQLAMRMADAVEDDAHAVARSLNALLSSLKSALSKVTTSSVANMRIENEAAGQVQDAAIDAASKGNRFINACLRLNEEMKGMERVASQLEALKVKVDEVESQASRYLTR